MLLMWHSETLVPLGGLEHANFYRMISCETALLEITHMNATCVLICMYQQSMYWTFAIGGATLMRLLIFLLHAKKVRTCQHH